MPSPSDFHDLVSGKRQGLAASLIRMGLRAAEVPYTWAVRYRNHRFDRGHSRAHQAGVPVVSVGNLTLGGTGKTPMIAWLANWFLEKQTRIAIVSRGYGGSEGESNDESRELADRLGRVLQFQNPDRVAAAKAAVEQGAQLILLDDGFQHRRLGRDLDIVLIDALQPTGFGHVFPRGCLREPFRSIRRADVVILTRGDMISPADSQRLRREVAALAPQAIWLEASHSPNRLLDSLGEYDDLRRLEQETSVAFCGIGNPRGFRHTLSQCGCNPRVVLEFPDHHRYTPEDLERIRQAANNHAATLIACTHKDLVKIRKPQLGSTDLRAVRIDLQLKNGRELEQRLESIRARVEAIR